MLVVALKILVAVKETLEFTKQCWGFASKLYLRGEHKLT